MWEQSQLNAVTVELTAVLGRSRLSMRQLLRMGRGAVIPLDAGERDPVWILANNHPIARGEITISGERITVTITDVADHYDFAAQT